MKQDPTITATELKSAMFGAPSASVFSVPVSVMATRGAAYSAPWCAEAPSTVAVAAASAAAAVETAAAAVVPAAMATARAAFGRIDAQAWDTTGGAPSFQAHMCANVTTLADITTISNVTAVLANKPAINKTKTNKRPPSWSGPPNG